MGTVVDNEVAFSSLLKCLKEVGSSISACQDDYNFLVNFLQCKDFRALIQVHDRISMCNSNTNFIPVASSAQEIFLDVLEELEPIVNNTDAQQLAQILLEPYMQLPDISLSDETETEETRKIVQLVKSDDPQGATIKSDDVTGHIYIARIMHGGAADRSGLISVGDIVEEVNEIPVKGKSPTEVLDILKSSEGTVLFKLLPRGTRCQNGERQIRMKACFDFHPNTDKHIPCQEAGLQFACGDVLLIVSQDDPYWWQAQKDNQRNAQAGLIPSKVLQEKRILLNRAARADEKIEGMFDCPTPEELPTYDKVTRLYPWHGLCRPIVLIGPPGVGRTELAHQLVLSSPDVYARPVLYTSRAPRVHEVAGCDYHFISQKKLEEGIREGRYIECLRRGSCWYAIAGDSILQLIQEGLVPVITPHCQDEELEMIIELGARMEMHHRHLCDAILVNDKLVDTVSKLQQLAQSAQQEPQWVPVSWTVVPQDS